MGNASKATPAAVGERIELLDGLRGFALLGVFLANMMTFSGWAMLSEGERAAMAGAQGREIFDGLVLALVDGKFYTIFSFLFGIGFALQIARLDARGDRGAARFRRRLFGLLAIGLAHLVLIWFGDILTLYALAGFVLLAVRGWSDRALLWTAAGLILLPIPASVLVHLLGAPADLGFTGRSFEAALAMGADPNMPPASWMRRPDVLSFLTWQLPGVIWRIGSLIEQWRPFKVVAIMMIGLWAGRRLIAGTLIENRRLLWRVWWLGLAVGVPANLLYAEAGTITGPLSWERVLGELGYALGVVPLGLAYAAGFALAWPRARAVLGLFVAPGRMAVTNYLSQSVIGVLIGHGIGLGLAGLLSPVQFVPLVFAIFAIQAVLSAWWLRRFGQGPVERLWRRMTYGRA